jgi:hypothetical protein
MGSPHWDPYARGTIVGLTRGTGREHLARAALEAIAYQTVDAVRAMEVACGVELSELRADGGATANHWLMQFQADVLGVPVVVPEIAETTGEEGGSFLFLHRQLGCRMQALIRLDQRRKLPIDSLVDRLGRRRKCRDADHNEEFAHPGSL